MPYIITEPVKIEGTDLGYAVYPYQFSFLDHVKVTENNAAKLYIFKMKESRFIEVEKTLFEKEFSLSMQTAHVVDETLKKFIITHEKHVKDAEKLEIFFKRPKRKEFKNVE